MVAAEKNGVKRQLTIDLIPVWAGRVIGAIVWLLCVTVQKSTAASLSQ